MAGGCVSFEGPRSDPRAGTTHRKSLAIWSALRRLARRLATNVQQVRRNARLAAARAGTAPSRTTLSARGRRFADLRRCAGGRAQCV